MLVFSDERGAAGALARDLHGRLERLGVYEPEQRPVAAAPHRRAVPRAAAPRAAAGPASRTISPSGAAVYHSVLRPTGAQYVVVQEFALGG